MYKNNALIKLKVVHINRKTYASPKNYIVKDYVISMLNEKGRWQDDVYERSKFHKKT